MRTTGLLLVAISMIVSCSNAEPAQSQGPANGGSPNDSAGGMQSSGSSKASSQGGSVTKSKSGDGGASSESLSQGGADEGTSEGGNSAASSKGRGGSVSSSGGSEVGSPMGGSAHSGGGASGSKSSGGAKSGSAGSGVADGGSTSSGAPTTALGCDRAGLQAAVDAYLAAIEAKDPTKMPTSDSVKYTEVTVARGASVALGEGLWKTAQPVKFSRSLLDVTGCETFTEVFITETSHPYVLGTRLAVKDGKITEIYTIATDEDDWNFDASAYATCSESEDWSVLPEASRSSREALIAAGQAYFDIFSDKSTVVPWGNPCYRLEGGKGCTPAMDKASTSCNVGIPDNITFKNTHWVVDIDIGAAVGITLFAGASPDTHLFRLVSGKIRYVHTLTIMN